LRFSKIYTTLVYILFARPYWRGFQFTGLFMSLNLDHFVAASQGHSTAEVYLEKPGNNPSNARLGVRGKAGRLITSDARLKRDRAEVASAFRNAILDKIGSHAALFRDSGDGLKSLYQRNLKNIAADLEASLDAQIRGDRALTATDIQTLTSRLDKKLRETTDKTIEAHIKEVHLHGASTQPEAQARQDAAWNSLCPNTPKPADHDQTKLALRAYFSARADIAPEKLLLIDERLDRAENSTGTPLEKDIALAEELEGLHKDLLGYSVDLAVDRHSVALNTGAVLGSGTFGTVSSATINGESKVVKEFAGGDTYPLTLDATFPATELKLSRDLELTAAYLRDREKDFIVAPSHFLVNETIPGRPVKQFLVEVRDKEFRSWAKDQLFKNTAVAGYELEIVGQIQDKAEGADLNHALDHHQLKEDMIQPIALSYVNALIAMAKRGFVHGDIKPANTFFDPATNRLKLIDTGGMAKVSKRFDREDDTLSDADRGVTPAYSLPCIGTGQKVGFEQDLYSVGASILAVSLLQRGKADLAERALVNFSDNTFDVLGAAKSVAAANADVENFLDTSILPSATPRERVAVDMIKQAIAFSRLGYLTDRDGYLPYLEDFKSRL